MPILYHQRDSCGGRKHRPDAGKCECGAEGTRRYDSGLDIGIYCNGCWDRISSVPKERSNFS